MTTTATTTTGFNTTRGRQSGRAAAVQLTNLTKSFGSVEAVRGIDLTVQPGEVVAFLGPNGAGKTSTIDIILGLSDPTSGWARVFGLEPHDAIRHGLVSAVMQTGGLLKDLTVKETVIYMASLFSNHQNVDEVMATAGLTELADRKVGKCSGGEQQRLRFAMALVSDPELLILDEPTTGMDVGTRRSFWEQVHADAQKGRTVLFATHYLEEADTYADRIVLVRKGQIVADGTASEIKALGTGRTIRATWPGVTDEAVRAIPHSDGIDIRGDVITVRAKDSDAVARYLLTDTPARDLEITARGLEEAFVALTGDDAPVQEG